MIPRLGRQDLQLPQLGFLQLPQLGFLQLARLAFPQLARLAFPQLARLAFLQLARLAFLQPVRLAFPQLALVAFPQLARRQQKPAKVFRQASRLCAVHRSAALAELRSVGSLRPFLLRRPGAGDPLSSHLVLSELVRLELSSSENLLEILKSPSDFER
ncbi:MAG TPA: hypothetical protein PLY87_27245 [Planctomycetaceae bacterium]|nr:hypothetical protein [Planctomycetaceae bacterium]HQZ68825.1 hypothetical protein [Planctomycetaceae bacterium]